LAVPNTRVMVVERRDGGRKKEVRGEKGARKTSVSGS